MRRLIAFMPLLAQAAAGQVVDAPGAETAPEPPTPVFLEPIHEGGVRRNRGIHIPVNLRTAPERRFSAGYTASNSFLNPGFLVCADGSCELEYESDHTGNLLYAGATLPLPARFELGFSLGVFAMNNLPDGLLPHRLANDGMLRRFHEGVLDEDSLPVLSNAPDGRQVFTMTDLSGRRLTLEPEHSYTLPLGIDLTRYVEIRRSPTAQMNLNVGFHLAVPLEGGPDNASGRTALARGIDAGVSANFVHTRRISANVASTWHVQLGRFRHDVHVVNPESPWHGDDLLRSQYALTYGLRFGGAFRGHAACSFSMSQVSSSAHFDKAKYWTWDPVVFEGGNDLRGAILGANDYGMLSFGCEHRGRRYQVSLAEDVGGLSQVISDDGAGTSYDPDFAIGVAVSWLLGAQKGVR